MSLTYREMPVSFRSIVDGGSDSDIVYYNASIITTNQRSVGVPETVEIVKFNEARDAPIIKDASQYEASIIRFAMNGPNKNLPLFIPIIQLNTVQYPPFSAQIDPNLTVYYVSIAYQRNWTFTNNSAAAQTKTFTVAPLSTALIYRPETQNTTIAPVPQAPVTGFDRQNISSRYYWVYTYKHWADLVNETMLAAMGEVYDVFTAQWNADPDIDLAASPFPYPTFQSFLNDHDAPFIKYNEESKLFEIYGDTRAFNVSGQLTGVTSPAPVSAQIGVNIPVPPFVAPAIPAVPFPAQPASTAYLRLFFNQNLFNLFSNFNNTFLNAVGGSSILFPLTGTTPITIPTPPFAFGLPTDYCNEILFTNQNYTNILNNNPTLQGSQNVPPPAYNPYFLIPTNKQTLYWIAKQDYNSTNSLWSPCAAIVFTSTLLPVKKEFTGKPVVLGTNNNSGSVGSQSAFEPIISDFVIDQQQEKAEGWRDFTLYEPTAEYKMISLTASHDEIRNIDLQVFWKYRLTGELIPLTMSNTSDVTIKMMFRKLDYKP